MWITGGRRWFFRAAATGCLLTLAATSAAIANPPGSLFDDRRSLFGWLRHVEGDQIGDAEPFSSIGGNGFLLVDNGVWTINGEVLVSNDGDPGGSLGLGRRFWIGADTIAGTTLAYESSKSPFGNEFRQAVLSLELFHGSWSFRSNGYEPLGDRVEDAVPSTFAGSVPVTFIDSVLATTADTARIDETSMGGYDFEIARDLGSARAEAYLGYSSLSGKIGDDADGPKGGVRAWITPRLTAELTVSDDDLFGTNAFGGLTWTFAGSRQIPRSLEDKLTVPVARSTQVAVNPVLSTLSANSVLTAQGAAIRIAHVVAGGAPGSGAFGDPYGSLDAAEGSLADIIYVGSGSVFNGESFELRENQSLIGEGDGAVHRIATDQLGLIELPTINGSGLARPQISGAPGAAITLADGAFVSNFDIFNSGTGLEAGDLSVGAWVERVRINGGLNGISVVGGFGDLNFSDVEINNPIGVAFNLNGGSSSVTFDGNIDKDGTSSAIEITNHSGGSIDFRSGAISVTGGSGLQFNNADGEYNFDGSLSMNGGDAGIDILGDSNGTFRFADAEIVNPTGEALTINGGSAAVSYSGEIIKSSGGNTIAITNHSGGTITFEDGSIQATDGSGLQFNNADGTYDFAGNVTLNGGNAGIDILGGSNGEFTFADASIIGPTGTAFQLNGGGATVSYSGNISGSSASSTISVTNHAGGSLTFQDGAISATSGTGLQFNNADGTYTFDGSVSLNGGDAGIDILGSSNGDFTFADATILDPNGPAFNVNGGSANVSFNGNMAKSGLGSLLSITNHTGGTIAFGGGTIAATDGTGLLFSGADGSYSFQGVTTLNGGDAGIDILGGSDGTFLFDGVTINNPSSAAFNVMGLGPNGDIDFNGSITNDNDDLITIRGTTAGSTIDFNDSGGNSLSGSGGGGILIVDADGDVSVNTPTTITDPTNAFGLSGVSVSGGSGTVRFTNTTVAFSDALGGFFAAVRVDDQNGTVGFTNLDIVMNSPGSVGLSVTDSGTVEISGINTIETAGGAAVDMRNVDAVNVTFDSISVTDSQAGFGNGSGVRLRGLGAGTFESADTTVDGAAIHGIEIDDSAAAITFSAVNLRNTTADGMAIGLLAGNPGQVTVNGGSIDGIGGDGIHVDGAGGFTLNDVEFGTVGGFTVHAGGTALVGSGNTATPLTCNDGGGNTGRIEFNEGAESCP